MKRTATVSWIVLIAAATLVAATRPASADEGRLANLEYRTTSTKSGTAKLVNGEYREPAAPGSASETVIKLTDMAAAASFGGIKAAAVILVTETGGSGTFYDLALVFERNGTLVNVDTVRLGDRVKVTSLDLVKGAVVLDMIVPGPNDPACCPTQHVVRKYAITNEKLVPVASVETAPVKGATLTDNVWQWSQTKQGEGTAVAPDDPSKYTIEFLDEGKIDARVDCNRVFGTYTVSTASLSITPQGGTTAECPPKTWGREFVKQLNAAQSFVIRDGDLYITLSSNRGTMKFVRAGTAPK